MNRNGNISGEIIGFITVVIGVFSLIGNFLNLFDMDIRFAFVCIVVGIGFFVSPSWHWR